MKHLVVMMFALGAVVLGVAQAVRADDTVCRSELFQKTINGNLVVPERTGCALGTVTVTGNVYVGKNAFLQIYDFVTVSGNIQADGCDAVVMGFEAVSIAGNLSVEHCIVGSLIEDVRITGNVSCQYNKAPCILNSNSIAGNVQVSHNGSNSRFFGDLSRLDSNHIVGNVEVDGNAGRTAVVKGNHIGGNLQCEHNATVSNEGSPNTVTGTTQGQCTGL